MEGDDENQPVEDQPLLGHNLLIPVVLLVVLIFVLLVETGTVSGTEQSFMDKIESSDSYAALLWGTLATAWLTLILYLLQITIPGTSKLCWPTPARVYDMMPWRKSIVEERGELQPRFLLSVGESIEGFLYGMGRIFLAIVVLTLAWGSGSLMQAIGVDRLFAGVIVSGAIPFQLLPMLTFLIALLMALATGTSWGVRIILIIINFACRVLNTLKHIMLPTH
jgi:Na+/H+ antiporter NhaC